jgi:hypothetical protein
MTTLEKSMAIIIAGNFEHSEPAELAVAALARSGIPRTDVCIFALNAPGQHDMLPLGGDQNADAKASGGDEGAAKGAAVGAAVGLGIGLAATPVVGPIGVVGVTAAGAYVGGLAGGLSSMGDQTEKERRGDAASSPARRAGAIVAVNVSGAQTEESVAAVLRANGARTVERAVGEWRDGQWVDFDPVQALKLLP